MTSLSEYIEYNNLRGLFDFSDLAEIVHLSEDWEILVGLLQGSTNQAEAADVAYKLLQEFGSLPAVLTQTTYTLNRIEGVTPEIAHAIMLIRRTIVLVAEKRILKKPALNNWQSIEAYCRVLIGFRSEQNIVAIYLDAEFRPIRAEHLMRGTVDQVEAYPRELITRALQLGASSVIVAKNVPTGRLNANPCEVQFAERLQKVCEALEIYLMDCVLVGKNGVKSLLKN
ncbi:MAG: JAB domain-containing protein [Pseudomonadota bacterium]